MMVIFVSECEKGALKRTRRILDSFADRIGTSTWRTVITKEGLNAVQKLLRKSATKNTAVACHWIRSRNRSDLLWIVGNREKFNNNGIVAVNYTQSNLLKNYMEPMNWATIDIIQYATAFAALFHDFGKASVLFQKKIDPTLGCDNFEPYRHEWVSLRIFQGFVAKRSDEEWIDALIQSNFEDQLSYIRDGIDNENIRENNPLTKLPPFASFVAWMILAHHKLPLYPQWQEGYNSNPEFSNISSWLTNYFDADWNSFKCKQGDQKDRLNENWAIVDRGLPFKSSLWRSYACLLASRAKTILKPYLTETDWVKGQLFTAHISRICLMLADHHYSSKEPSENWQDATYTVWANSNRETKEHKQRLDEHLIGVTDAVMKITTALPKLNESLDSLKNNDFLESRVKKEYKETFGWQDKAKKLADTIAKSTIEYGFFGINMASTGKGKTLANAKIMNAIGSKIGRTRFSVALGLRTLTLQTGREYRKQLKLTDEDLAILVGGAALKQLFENSNSQEKHSDELNDHLSVLGSESLEEIIDDDTIVDYKGTITKHSLSEWTKQERNLDQIINAPILVCTIDHLMPATEGTKGGRQIAPMLRLLTSDLILDEPDDFGLEDLPALCRLVHMAGMLGSRVLLSTATMPPSLAYALFLAYQDGWKEYAKANLPKYLDKIACAWFDENYSEEKQIADIQTFQSMHEHFVKKRVKRLENELINKRLGRLVEVTESVERPLCRLAKTIFSGIITMHKNHHQSNGDTSISVGMVRMANIDPLVAVATELLSMETPKDTCIHYCIYHSRFPLAVRSHIEKNLDKILTRKDPDKIWVQLDEKIKNSSKRHHIFVVLASPVAEVGRDHDYDWAIVEPSSMRSVIQLAGRVLRHRNITPKTSNVLLLNKNYKALIGKERCFMRPGFEIGAFKAEKGHSLSDILEVGQYETINAVPRIIAPPDATLKSESWSNLVDMEHMALTYQLFIGNKPANVWWKYHPQWCGEVQRQQPFRKSQLDEPYYLWLSDENSHPKWKWKNEHVKPAQFGEISGITIEDYTIDVASGNEFWFDLNVKSVYTALSKELTIDNLEEISQKYGEVRIVEYANKPVAYYYHPNLGLFQQKGN